MPQEINCPDSFFKASATEKKPKSLKQKIPAFLFDWVFCLPLSNTHLLFSFSIFLNSNTSTSSHFHFPFLQPPRFSSFFTFLCSNLSHFPTPSPFLYSNALHSAPFFFSYIPTHPSFSRFSFLFTPTPPASPHFSLPFSPIYPISLHLLLLSIPMHPIPHHFSFPSFHFLFLQHSLFHPISSQLLLCFKTKSCPQAKKIHLPSKSKTRKSLYPFQIQPHLFPLKKKLSLHQKAKTTAPLNSKFPLIPFFSSLSHPPFFHKTKKG